MSNCKEEEEEDGPSKQDKKKHCTARSFNYAYYLLLIVSLIYLQLISNWPRRASHKTVIYWHRLETLVVESAVMSYNAIN